MGWLVALAIASAAQTAPVNVSCAAAPDLTLVEKARSAAIAGHDAAFLDRLYFDDFQGITNVGADVGKPALLALFARLDGSTDFTLEALESVPVGSDAAISRGRLVARRGGAVVGQSRFLHVYRRFGCEWRIVSGISTPIPHG